MRIPGLTPEENLVIEVMRQHVEHGHGEIKIQIQPGRLRIQEGRGHLFDKSLKNT